MNVQPPEVDRRLVYTTSLLVLAAAVAMVVPLMMTSFLGDDIWDSVIDGVTSYTGQSFKDFVLAVNWSILQSNGRLQMPALFQYFGIFAAIPNLFAYKALQVVFMLVNLATFYALLRTLLVSKLTALVFVAFAVGTFQMRVYHDPILGFSLLYQAMLEFNLISFALFARFCRTEKKSDLIVSASFFFLALFYYETSYPLSIVHLLIAARFKGWPKWYVAAPFLGLSALFFAISLGIRQLVHMSPDAMYRLSLDPGIYFLTLAKQLVAAVPLSYLMFVGPRLFTPWWQVYDSAPAFMIAAVAIVSLAAIGFPLANARRIFLAEHGLKAIAMIGFALWILSAALVATLPRYQTELQFGLGYLPVYFEDYGVALVLGSIAVVLLRFIARLANTWQWQIVSVAIGLVFSFVVSATYSANAFVINTYASEKYGRAFLASAIERGSLRALSPGDTLFINGISESVRHFGDFRDSKYFLYQATGEEINTLALTSVDDYFHCHQASCPAKTNDAFVMLNYPLDARTGYAIVGRVAGVVRVLQGGVPAMTPTLKDVLLYTSGPQLGSRAGAAAYGVSWQLTRCTPAGGFDDRTARLSDLIDRRSGNEWRIVTLPTSCGAIPLASMGVYSNSR